MRRPRAAARTPARPDPGRPALVPAAAARPTTAPLTPAAAERPLPIDRLPADYRWSVVPHTHWDREWYLPFEHFRMRMARVVDDVIEVLERDSAFRHFTLDGQAVLLEDYLAVRPERAGRLRALIAAGRISIGPLYTLPDEFLVAGESLVRNLLVGRETARRLGAEPMAVGYLPDSFGHVAQLPQILRGFGLDAFVFWRGLGDEAESLGAVFRWGAPDGSEVLAVRQLGSYGSASELGRWGREGRDHAGDATAYPVVAADRFLRFLERWGGPIERSGIGTLLLCNGSDHQPIQERLPELLDFVRQVHAGIEVVIDGYPGYVASLRAELGERETELPLHHGELCAGRETPVLRGINSARMHLKQENERCERALLAAEALGSLAALDRGAAQPLEELRVAWRELLKNHPHDSISGCSVDEVHRDMEGRFRTARSIAERVRREALAALAGAEEPWSYRSPVSDRVSAVNPLPFRRRGLVRLSLPGELDRERGVRLTGRGGALLTQPAADGDELLTTVEVDGWGAEPLALEPGKPGAAPAEVAAVIGADSIENGYYRVTALPSGQLSVLHLPSGRRFEGLHRFEDQADRGDEYNFCPLEGDVPLTADASTGSVRVVSSGPVVAELEVRLDLELPAALSPDRHSRSASVVRCSVTTRVRLVAGIDRIELRTTFDNQARDHRLRVRFRSPAAGDRVRAEGHFGLVERPARPASGGAGWSEPPIPTQHTAGFVSGGDLTLLGAGLPEYEAIPTPEGDLDLALTLLRCVGWLSRDDLASRPGHAGPELATPEAQCLGRHELEYALRIGSFGDAELLRSSQDYRFGLEVGPSGVEPRRFLELHGEQAVFAALKPAENGEGVILRVLNAGGRASFGVAARGARIERCRMDEEPQEAPGSGPLAAPGRLDVPARAWEIATFRIRPVTSL